MAVTTLIKSRINSFLRYLNLRIETLTSEKMERARLERLEEGHFKKPVFTMPQTFFSMEAQPIFEELLRYRDRFDDFEDHSRNDVQYTFHNDYFSSPDAEVLYVMVRKFCPKIVIEVGSGFSTQVTRQAILDGGLKTQLIAIDPEPRAKIRTLVSDFFPLPVETLKEKKLFQRLQEKDILFIDSSHVIKTANDVTFLYLEILPYLAPGVVLHFHDIFLPYDYPREWVLDPTRGFNEQYFVQSLLTFSGAFEVLWAGHFLQRTQGDFSKHFPHLKGRIASSLWLRKKN